MRLPHDRINGKWVAASKPQALEMDANLGYHVGDSGIRHVVCQYPTVDGGRLNMYFAGMTTLIGQFEIIRYFSASDRIFTSRDICDKNMIVIIHSLDTLNLG
jgi:hypothetical protein